MFPEVIFAFLGGLLVLGLVICFLLLPVIAFVRSRRIVELEERLRQMHKDIRRLERRLESATTVTEVARSQELAEVEIVPAIEAVAQDKPVSPRRSTEMPAFDLEAWIGGRGLGWIAVVLLLLAGGFFLQQVFERGLIGELGRVAIGLAIGVALCVAGYRFHRRGWAVFAQMLTAGGIVLLYLCTFATFGFYHLLAREHAVFFFVAILVQTAFLAILYEAPAIAIMAVIGGLLTPVLLHSDRDQYRSLFVYLAVLNAGTVLLTWYRPRWPAVSTLALVGTQALFWGWYNENYHPLKLPAVSLFQLTLFVLYLIQGVISRRGQPAGIEDLVRLTVNAFFFALAGYVLLDPDHHLYMGTFAVVLAIVYALMTWVALAGRQPDARQALVALAVSMAFVATVFPLQADKDAVWIAVGWAVQGLVLWWFGLRVAKVALRGMGGVFLVLATVRLLLVDTPRAHAESFIPLLNTYGLPAVVVAGCLIAAAVLARRFPHFQLEHDAPIAPVLGLAGVATLWIVLSVETWNYFTVQADRLPETAWKMAEKIADDLPQLAQQRRFEQAVHLRQSAQTALSILWAAYAGILLAVGLRLGSRPLRWTALILFGVTLVKVLLVDMERLPGFYRVLAFLALSIMMAAGAWGYQKMKRSLQPASPPGDSA